MAENSLLTKVLGLQEKYDSLQAQLSDPDVISDTVKRIAVLDRTKEPGSLAITLDWNLCNR